MTTIDRDVLAITKNGSCDMGCNCLNVRVIGLVDLSVSYYNSKHQVKWLLARLRRLVMAIDARDWHEPVPQLSGLALACRNGKPRAIRDRLTPDEYEHLLEAVRAGVSKPQLAKQFGVSLRSVYRLPIKLAPESPPHT